MNLFKRKPPPLQSILFVCTANVTRSPVAESLFKHEIAKTGETWKVASAGVNAAKGISANPTVSFVMSKRGTPIANHRSQPVTAKLLNRYYWIIVMEAAHKSAILEINPDVGERLFTMREIGLQDPPDQPDMPDPTGKEVGDFQELFQIFDYEIPRLVKAIQAKNSDAEGDRN